MKKILFLGLSTMITAGAFAQQKSLSILKAEVPTEQIIKGTYVPAHQYSGGNSQTRATNRWYSSADAVSKLLGTNLFDATHAKGNYLWQDSTMLGNFGGTQDHIWIKSIAQVLDPKSLTYNDATNYPGEFAINSTTASYSVDSVGLTCFYTRAASKASIVDTLIVTVSKGNTTTGSDLLFWKESQAVVVGNYAVDTIYIGNPTFNFSTLTLDKQTGSTAYTKKILLTAASANDTTSGGLNYFQIPVSGISALPGTALPVMTVTFKSGDTWVANVDSLGSNFNHFNFLSSRENPPSGFRTYTKRDYNISSILENDTTGWGKDFIPSFYFNSPSYEHHWFDWNLSCTTCKPVAVNNVTSGINVTVVPNPAQENAVLSINLKESAKNVSITLTNTVGQLVKTMNIGAISANTTEKYNMNVSSLSAGLYIYTVNADGKKYSSKLMVK